MYKIIPTQKKKKKDNPHTKTNNMMNTEEFLSDHTPEQTLGFVLSFFCILNLPLTFVDYESFNHVNKT